SCECQGVVFELIGELRDVVFCHCSQCRKTSGHYWAATQVSKGNLNLIKATSLSWYDSSDNARRGFCSLCGSSMFYERKGIDKISVSAGSLEIPTSLDRMRHIYVASKGDYYDISDDLPQFEEY
ncbi:MAG: GFA family protein, partial [Pseudomonadota bacterium]|nr:GFA family protein [Pseudomonadota bacterium]